MTAAQGAEEPSAWCALDTGHEGDHDMEEVGDCPACDGRGELRGPEWEDWDRQLLGTCPDCKGSGKNV